MSETREPMTKAGRELLAMEDYNSRSFPLITAGRILRIEVEARADALPTVERLADVLHSKVCGPFATIDPQQCLAGRSRDETLARALLAALHETDTPETER